MYVHLKGVKQRAVCVCACMHVCVLTPPKLDIKLSMIGHHPAHVSFMRSPLGHHDFIVKNEVFRIYISKRWKVIYSSNKSQPPTHQSAYLFWRWMDKCLFVEFLFFSQKVLGRRVVTRGAVESLCGRY